MFESLKFSPRNIWLTYRWALGSALGCSKTSKSRAPLWRFQLLGGLFIVVAFAIGILTVTNIDVASNSWVYQAKNGLEFAGLVKDDARSVTSDISAYKLGGATFVIVCTLALLLCGSTVLGMIAARQKGRRRTYWQRYARASYLITTIGIKAGFLWLCIAICAVLLETLSTSSLTRFSKTQISPWVLVSCDILVGLAAVAWTIRDQKRWDRSGNVQLRLTLYTVILLTFTQGALLQFGLWGKQLFPPSLDLIVSTDCRSDICYGYVSSENAKRMVLDMPIQMSVSTKLFRPEDSSQAGEVFVQAQLQIEPVLPGAGPVTLTSDGEVTVRLTNITFKCEAKRLRNQYVAPQNATGSTMVHYPGGTVDARINVNVSGWLFPLFRGHGVNCTVDNAPTT